jgi:predicted amidophosphoribosyltransferase
MVAAAETEKHERDRQRELQHDLKTLALFIQVYCRSNHQESDRGEVHLRTHDVAAIAGKSIVLCPECTKLLAHAFVKRSNCPHDPKPMCKHCPNHCYHPTYRAQIRQVMKFSGRKMLLSGRLDYLLHLLF